MAQQIKITQTSNADMNIGVPKKQTAVEWLDEKLQDKMFIQYGYGTGIRKIVIPIDYYMEFIKQAKQMEKEQLHKCASFWRGKENEIEKPIFEQYYNETFKTT